MKKIKDLLDLNGEVGFVRLYRAHLPKKHKGPRPGGHFWALTTCNDLPPCFDDCSREFFIFMSPNEFFERHEEVYLGNAKIDNSEWIRITEYPSYFKMEYSDNWKTGVYGYAKPYMPEVYAIKMTKKRKEG